LSADDPGAQASGKIPAGLDPKSAAKLMEILREAQTTESTAEDAALDSGIELYRRRQFEERLAAAELLLHLAVLVLVGAVLGSRGSWTSAPSDLTRHWCDTPALSFAVVYLGSTIAVWLYRWTIESDLVMLGISGNKTAAAGPASRKRGKGAGSRSSSAGGATEIPKWLEAVNSALTAMRIVGRIAGLYCTFLVSMAVSGQLSGEDWIRIERGAG
jgi:hypothetical protein